MAAQNFEKCTRWVLVHEGGYVNHPKDPGGATNKGVTQKVYDAYLINKGEIPITVKQISDKEVLEIYKEQYWDRANCDALPSGLDYAVYDFAINSGVKRAITFLQEIVGVTPDGVMGAITLEAIMFRKQDRLIEDLCLKRWNWMKTLKTFKTFGKGWTARVMGKTIDGVQSENDDGVIDRACWLAENVKNIRDPEVAAPGKAQEGDEATVSKIKESINLDNVIKVGGGVVPGAMASAAALPSGPLQWAVAAIAIIGALVVAVIVIRKFK